MSSVFVPSGAGNHWVFGIGEDLVGSMEAPELTRLIRTAAGVPHLQPRIHQIRTFKFAAGIAERFRSGSALLVGDAADRVTPLGGTGMNTAIADGYDLGWKLSWVLKGWAGEQLLDTYEAERRPVVAHNVERSVDERGSYRDPINEIHIDLGVGLRTSGSRRSADVSRRSTSSATDSRCSRARTAGLGSKLLPRSTAPHRSRFGSCRR
jgi:2-polyprenyl-6-methoxyphenol hydroxylase-like FAD-dependent oxidoreductase